MIGRKNRASDGDEDDRPHQRDDQGGTQPAAGDGSLSQVDALRGEIDRLREERDRFLRVAADADNRAKSARKEVQESYRQGVTSVARDAILCLDAFDMALSQEMCNANVESVLAGVRSIKGELIRVLTRHGVGLIEPAPGDELDPNRHQAMLEQPSVAVPAGRVLALVQAGYVLDDRVIRPAKVIVARNAESNPGSNPAEEMVSSEGSDRPPGDQE